MGLPNDTSRCVGADASGVCKERESCERYLQVERDGGNESAMWIPFAAKLCHNGIYDSKIQSAPAKEQP